MNAIFNNTADMLIRALLSEHFTPEQIEQHHIIVDYVDDVKTNYGPCEADDLQNHIVESLGLNI